MGMKLKEGDVSQLQLLLKQYGERATRAARREMRKKAIEVRDLAKINAPVLEENLEDAIIMEEQIGEKRRKEFIVGVDMAHIGTNAPTVEQYAIRMHEGVYNPGPKSVEKMSTTGRFAGRKYLERAYDEVLPTVVQDMIKAIRKIKDRNL